MAKPRMTFERSSAQLASWREFYNVLHGLSMRKLNGWLDEADRGLYANVMWLLRKIERRNETVRACKTRMLNEVSRLEWRVQSPESLPAGVTQGQVDAQVTFLKERYHAIENLKAALKFLALADLRGFAHLEKHYGTDGFPAKLEAVPQWHWLKDGFYGAWKFDARASGTAGIGEAVNMEHFIVREVDDPWFEVALIRSLRSALGDKDYDGFLEDYGIPWIFLISPPGSSKGTQEDFQTVADQVVGDGRGVLPHGSDVKGPPGNAVSNADVFEKYLDRQQSAIVLAATGGLLTMLTQSGSGTLAGSAHQEAWENVVAGVSKDVSETFQAQFDKPLLEEKFPGQPVLAWFELGYPDQPESRKDFVTDVKMLKDAGFSVKREVVSEKSGLELDDAPDPAVTPPTKPEPGAVKNRLSNGSADTVQLASNALAEVLHVGEEYLAPLTKPLERLVALAESDTATADDFAALAREIELTFPELVSELPLDQLVTALEDALGPAAVLGVRDGMRDRKKA